MTNILDSVNRYYSEKIKEHGPTARGVDWNSTESQEIRFDQLTRIITRPSFSLLDYGCGYGALLGYLGRTFGPSFAYCGFDVSSSMIEEAVKTHEGIQNARWQTTLDSAPYEYVVASGIFNVRLQHNDSEWMTYILETLSTMDRQSTTGFSFNMLTAYSDRECMKDYLYYADPKFIFDHCKRHFSKHVALLHDYPLYEFTILVRKSL